MRTEEIIHSPYPLDNKHMVLLEVDFVVTSRRPLPQYNLYVGYNTKKIFSSHSLPSFIQSKLAMVNSVEKWNSSGHETTFHEIDCYMHHRYTKNNPEFQHIGWQVSDSIYVIVLDQDELTELQGISIDTRKESQRESQKDS